MKKFLVTSLLVFLCFCVFTGCIRDAEHPGFKKHHLENVDALFILNPTYNRKSINDNWVYLKTSARTVDAVKNDLTEEVDSSSVFVTDSDFDYVEHTIPFSFDSSNLELKTSEERAAGGFVIPPKTFIQNETLTFYDKCNSNRISQKSCVMKKEGIHCYVWVDEKADEDSTLSAEQIEEFAAKFDVIYEKEIALCGPKFTGETVFNGIINPYKKVSLVLFDIDSDKSMGGIYGYFHGGDFNSRNNYSYSNEIEAIYVDSYYAKQEALTPELYSAVAHEFNHMLNYVNKVLKYNTDNPTWFTEMLSMMTEDFFMDDQGVAEDKSVWRRYNNIFFRPGYNYGFGNWRDIYEESGFTSFNYANAYLFGAFLARNFGGAKLIHEIATNEFVGEEAVVTAVNKINGTNYTFTDLLNKLELVLVNLENENPDLPSLAKGTEEKLEGYDFVYKLKPVTPAKIIEVFNLDSDTQFSANKVSTATDNPFDSFGFQFYKFDSPTTVDVECEDFLQIKAFRK